MADAKFKLYSCVTCVSVRNELAALSGARVAVVDRRQSADGNWVYKVSPETQPNSFYDCVETELERAEPINFFADNRSFAAIRQALQSHLHQDFDLEFASIADALCAAAKHSDAEKLRAELDELEAQPDAIVEEVLNDHAVSLWDFTTPRDLLVTLKTLVNLQ